MNLSTGTSGGGDVEGLRTPSSGSTARREGAVLNGVRDTEVGAEGTLGDLDTGSSGLGDFMGWSLSVFESVLVFQGRRRGMVGVALSLVRWWGVRCARSTRYEVRLMGHDFTTTPLPQVPP